MKGEGDGKDLDRLRLEDGHTRQRLWSSRKWQCPFAGLCWNMTKYKPLLDKPFHASIPGSMRRIRGWPTLPSSVLFPETLIYGLCLFHTGINKELHAKASGNKA